MRKSLLKTVVATAIVGAVMSVSSVVAMATDCVSPADTTANWTYKEPGDYITVTGSGNNSQIKQDVYFDDGTVIGAQTNKDTIAGVKWSSGADVTIALEGLGANESGILTLYAVVQTSDASKYSGDVTSSTEGVTFTSATIYPGQQSSASNKVAPVKANITLGAEGTGSYTFRQTTTKEACVVYVTYTSNSSAYSWTLDTSNLSDVDASKVSLKSDSTTTLSNTLLYSGDDYTVKGSYVTLTDETAGVTVTDKSVNVVPEDSWFAEVVAPDVFLEASPDAGKIDFTTLTGDDKTVYEEGTVILNYFKTVGSKAQLRNNGGHYLETAADGSGYYFKLSEAAKVEVSFSSTGSSNTSDIAIKDSSDKNVSAVAVQAGTAKESLVVVNLPAGEYTIYSPNVTRVGSDIISRAARLYSVTFSAAETAPTIAETKTAIGSDYYCVYKDITYIIHPVSQDDFDTLDSITGPDGEPSSVVYTAIEFEDGSSISASEVGGAYIYGIKVTDAGRAPSVSSFSWE